MLVTGAPRLTKAGLEVVPVNETDAIRNQERLYLLNIRKHSGLLKPQEQQEYEHLREWYRTLPPPLEQPEQRRMAEALEHAVENASDEIQALL